MWTGSTALKRTYQMKQFSAFRNDFLLLVSNSIAVLPCCHDAGFPLKLSARRQVDNYEQELCI
jgi:hypothetical protein